jgi:alpha-galactosidase
MPIYAEYIEKHPNGIGEKDPNWFNKAFKCQHLVKFDLFKRYGAAAAAGDRHLAEFCEGSWYLKNPEHVDKWGFGLTPVSWRKEKLVERLERSRRLRSGEEAVKIDNTGEEGVMQMRALLGLSNLVTNVNLPNRGQIPNLPLGAVVETNAAFTADTVTPVFAGEIPEGVLALVLRNVEEQLLVARAVRERNLDYAFRAFVNDPLVTIDTDDAKALFDEMIENTKEYLKDYNL